MGLRIYFVSTVQGIMTKQEKSEILATEACKKCRLYLNYVAQKDLGGQQQDTVSFNRPFLGSNQKRRHHCCQQRVRQGKSLAARRRIIAHPIFPVISCGDRVATFCFFLLLLVGLAERVAGVGVAPVRVAGVPEPLQGPDGPVVRAHLADEHDAVLPDEGVLRDEREKDKKGRDTLHIQESKARTERADRPWVHVNTVHGIHPTSKGNKLKELPSNPRLILFWLSRRAGINSSQ